jgi:hypothetical protein
MNEPHSSATNGSLTYALGGLAALVSQMSLNDWLIIFSLVLVLMRIVFEGHEFMQRRADRKAALKQKFGIVSDDKDPH